jgi:hypothetical protein
MSLKGVISIAGVPGLYKVLAQTKSGFIVESIADQKRMPVSSTQKISMLDDISIFTTTDDLPLKDVLLKLKEFSETNDIIDAKAEPAQLREFFKKIIPDFDSERVYPSDIKKMITWFHLIKDFVAVEDETETEESDNAQDSVESTEAENALPEETTEAVIDEPSPKVAKPRKKKEPK